MIFISRYGRRGALSGFGYYMKCPNCHFENLQETRFCANCGLSLNPEVTVGEAEEKSTWSHTKIVKTDIHELTTGSSFAGRYQIIEELGQGGMGRVLRVLDRKVKEEIAIKLLKPEIASEKRVLERFSNELKNARRISHRNICRMYELLEDSGIHYITMEYVRGEDLKSFIHRSRKIAPGTAVIIARQVCEGLEEAHRLGIIHRDLKPQNIMIDKEGNARIMDFGIARSLETESITGQGVIIGTPDYMSPEQVEAKEVDARSDIYSLGIVLYEMVTGHLPFEGNTPLSIAVKHKTEPPPDPRKNNPQLSHSFGLLILKCMEKDPGKRFADAHKLLEELKRVEAEIPTVERIAPKAKSPTSREITVKLNLKKTYRLVGIGAALILLALGAWYFLLRDGSTAASGPPQEVPSAPQASDSQAEKPKPKASEAQPQSKLQTDVVLIPPVKTEEKSPTTEQKVEKKAETTRQDLAEAEKKQKAQLRTQEIEAQLRAAIGAFEAGEFKRCLEAANKALFLDPQNFRALGYAGRAQEQISSAKIRTMIDIYVQSFYLGNILPFYEKHCSRELYQAMRGDVELISRTYTEFKSVASNVAIQFKDKNTAEVSFSNITTGIPIGQERRRVIFEGFYLWTIERHGDDWKIVRIRALPAGVK